MNNQYAIILCGGIGSRLWPLSSEGNPKHLIKFINNRSLLQNTYMLISKNIPHENIFLVTNNAQKQIILDQIKELLIDQKLNLIIEPEGKNTLPAISLAIKEINKINKDAMISIFPSDHHIENTKSFNELFKYAFKILSEDNFVLFGVTPSLPSTQYGYLDLGQKLDSDKNFNIYKLNKFLEKPNLEQAQAFIKNGYLWNSGIYFFSLKAFIESLKKHQRRIFNNFFKLDLNPEVLYKKTKSISIDYGLSEKISNIIAIETNFGWSDLGDWKSLKNYLVQGNINYTHGNVNLISSENNLVWSDSKKIQIENVSNQIIIESNNCVFISNLDSKIKAEKRPWGYYEVLNEGAGFKIKKIVVNPQQRLSLQLHQYRSEHWVVVSGVANIVCGNNNLKLDIGQSAYIPKNTKHRLENNGDHPLIVIETSCGDFIDESDIKRFDDDYQRKI